MVAVGGFVAGGLGAVAAPDMTPLPAGVGAEDTLILGDKVVGDVEAAGDNVEPVGDKVEPLGIGCKPAKGSAGSY